MTRTGLMERKGKIDELNSCSVETEGFEARLGVQNSRFLQNMSLDRSFDLRFWQAQPPQARFDAAWELIVHYAKVKRLDVRQLRLHRSVETFQRQQPSGRPQDLIDVDLLSQSDAD